MDIRICDLIGLCILLRIETYFSFQTSGTQNTVCRDSEKILYMFMLDSNKKGDFYVIWKNQTEHFIFIDTISCHTQASMPKV